MARPLTMGEAAQALGVSVDTLRRWDRAGKIATFRDERNHRLVDAAEVQRLSAGPQRHSTDTGFSARGSMSPTPSPRTGPVGSFVAVRHLDLSEVAESS